MICCFQSVTDADLKAIVEQPERYHALSGELLDDEIEKPSPKPSLLGRLFGARAEPKDKIPQQRWKPQQPSETFDVDKAWHGIHFLLTNDPWEGNGPLAFILHGGTEIESGDADGNPHGFSASEVKAIAAALKDITPEELFAKADQAEFTANDIYPNIWERETKEECIGYVTEYFRELKQFIQKLADSNRGMIVSLG